MSIAIVHIAYSVMCTDNCNIDRALLPTHRAPPSLRPAVADRAAKLTHAAAAMHFPASP